MQQDAGGPLPVLVWFYGGGWNHGGTASPLFDGSYQVAKTVADGNPVILANAVAHTHTYTCSSLSASCFYSLCLWFSHSLSLSPPVPLPFFLVYRCVQNLPQHEQRSCGQRAHSAGMRCRSSRSQSTIGSGRTASWCVVRHPIRDTSCCCHPLTGVSCLHPGPRRHTSRCETRLTTRSATTAFGTSRRRCDGCRPTSHRSAETQTGESREVLALWALGREAECERE